MGSKQEKNSDLSKSHLYIYFQTSKNDRYTTYISGINGSIVHKAIINKQRTYMNIVDITGYICLIVDVH